MSNTHRIAFAQASTDLSTTTPQTLKEAADAYFVHHIDHLSDSYRRWTETRLRHLVQFLGPGLPLDKITIWQLDLWYSELANRKVLYENHPNRSMQRRSLAPSTLHGYVRAVKTMFAWLAKRRLIRANPAAALDFPQVPEQPPKHAFRNEVAALLEHFQDQRPPRNYVATRTLIATGMRAGGLTGLRRRNIDLKARLITVSEKGRGGEQKARTVPIDEETSTLLANYLQTHNQYWAFPSIRPAGHQLTTNALYAAFRRASNAIPLGRIVGPQMLRHYFGFEAVRRGLSLRIVQQIMGHSSSSTTEIYTKFRPVELRDAYDAIIGPNGTDPR